MYIDIDIFEIHRDIWQIQDKLEIEPSVLASIPEEGAYHNDDEDLVRLASHIDSDVIIVTTDDRLISTLNALGIPNKYGFKIERPEDAICLVN